MRTAVLSDIHGNLQALSAVLEDCQRQGADRFWLLGDYVDYGASSQACVAVLEKLDAEYVIAGNHDACLYLPFVRRSRTPHGKQAYAYTKGLVEQRPEAFSWLENIVKTPMLCLPDKHLMLVHGTPSDPYWGRFLPEENLEEMLTEMEHAGVRFLFLGHSHKSFVIVRNGKMIVNPGSVGQPRDGFPTASYAIVEGTEELSVTLRRVPYDVDTAACGIRTARLPEYLWQRLYQGI